MPSVILIRQTVWPQYTNVTDRQTERQDRTGQTDNGPIAQDEPFYKRSPKNREIAISRPRFDGFWPNLAWRCSSALL